jgi:Citrate synthase
MDLRQIKTDSDDFGLMTYDPALMNTASTKSAITFIDGDKGILEYRGYPVEQLAERCNFLEVAYLILFGELPNEEQLAAWTYDITHHTFVHEKYQDADAGVPLRRASHGNVHQHCRCAFDVLSRR